MNLTCKSENIQEIIESYLKIMSEEMAAAPENLSTDELDLFKAYYAGIDQSICTEAGRKQYSGGLSRADLRYIIGTIKRRCQQGPVHLLDAGCGLGTQSCLFALLGCRVTGVDIRKERVAIAWKRLDYYRQLGYYLDVEFLNINLMSKTFFEERAAECSYDLIWVTDAISHIHPTQDFLEAAFRLLKPHGEIIIVDPNGLYLPKQFKLLRNRGLRLYKSVIDPETGFPVPYAIERILTLPGICRRLFQAGFHVVHRQCFFGSTMIWSDHVYYGLIYKLTQFPVFSDLLGRRYVVVGRKEEVR